MASDRPDRRRRSSSAPEKPHAVDLGGATLVHRLLDASPLYSALGPDSLPTARARVLTLDDELRATQAALRACRARQGARRARIARNADGARFFHKTVFQPATWASGGRRGKLAAQEQGLDEELDEEQRLLARLVQVRALRQARARLVLSRLLLTHSSSTCC